VTNSIKILSITGWLIAILGLLTIGFILFSFQIGHHEVLILVLATIIFSLVGFIAFNKFFKESRDLENKVKIAEKEQAEQTKKHIEELQHHIDEQERISKALNISKERFRHAAFHDFLTGLPNRDFFMQELKFLLEKNKFDNNFKFAVLFLDLNRFKTVNDSLGHTVGDKLLVNVAKRIKQAISEEDIVARFGGDEFAIILKDVKNIEEAIGFANIVCQKISTPFTISGRQVFANTSIGIAISDNHYDNSEDILRDADIAMYFAKGKGNHYAVFDPSMHTKALEQMQLETDLRYAVARGEFCLYYQPIVDIESVKLSGFEALVRWTHPEKGIVSPAEFIPIAEETGLIIPMTLWILKTACQQIKEWQKISYENHSLTLSINLSGKHFAQNDLVEQIWKIMKETDFNPSCLKLEITESAVMENAEMAISMLKELKEIGIQLSIDDFGTGYSSLSYLHKFPIDILKVDRSFVMEMDEASENGEIVRTIVLLAKNLGMKVVAEGIETIHQLHQLRILGCEFGQGYLFSRPVPAEEAIELVRDKNQWQDVLPNQKIIAIIPNSANNTKYLQ
jgi:diguanylate cyclase (GGDEF)-like protein